MVTWRVELRGGAYDGWGGNCEIVPGPILVAWRCGPLCDGHATFDADEPAIVLRTAEAYRRVEFDTEAHRAVYEVGDGLGGPRVEESVFVGASASTTTERLDDALRRISRLYGLDVTSGYRTRP